MLHSNILDVRTAPQFHIFPSSRIAQQTFLRERCYSELPKCGECFAVLANDPEDAKVIEAALAAHGYSGFFVFTSISDLIKSFRRDLVVTPEPPPQCPLWKPQPVLRYFLPLLLKNRDCSDRPLLVLDLGSGVGRDAVYMAAAGLHVVCVEQRDSLLKTAANIAQRYSIPTFLIGRHVKGLAQEQLVTVEDVVASRESGGRIYLLPLVLKSCSDLSPLLLHSVHLLNVSRFYYKNIEAELFLHDIKFVLVHNFLPGAVEDVGKKMLDKDLLLQHAKQNNYQIRLDEVFVNRDRKGIRTLSMIIAEKTFAPLDDICSNLIAEHSEPSNCSFRK